MTTGDSGGVLRVAVDGMPLLGERTGVGNMTQQLVSGLAARPTVSVIVYAVTRTGRRDLAALIPPGTSAGTATSPARVVQRIWKHVAWPRIEHWSGPVDVVHATNFVAPPARAPVVVTVHDLAFLRFPELCRPETAIFTPLLERALARGAHVHAVSDTVADEVQDAFSVEPERVTRVYVPIAPSGGDPDAGLRLAGGAPYVLALGTVEPRKNLPRLVAAFDQLATRMADITLVVAGPDGWGVDAFTAASRAARHGDRIRRLGYVTDEQRRDLLAGAAVLAYPSLYEGFGHPPLEAMAAGVPVVAGRAGAVPEAVGDAALLVDPLDVEDLAGALEIVLTDPSTRDRLTALGRERIGRFSQPAALDEFERLYRRLASIA
jgi:glycosyltransferase involved in cell wall biosynthesis